MKKTIKFLMLAFVAMLACVSFSSCSEDEEWKESLSTFYVSLTKVDTNLVDANGNNLAQTYMDAWDKAENATNGKKTLGKVEEKNAIKAFDQYIESYKSVNAPLCSSMPKGGILTFSFVLVDEKGKTYKTATVTLTDKGVE